jgi:hypothetical protein
MKRILLAIIFLSANALFSHAQSTQPDMTVFGYKLGEKMSIPECPCKIVEAKTVGNYGVLSIKHFKGYQYVTPLGAPVSTTCFERADIGKYNVRKSDPLNPLPELSNGIINIRFAPNDAPAKEMCPFGSFNAVIENAKFTGAVFSIYTGDANNVFEALKKKYGNNAVVQSYKIQNGYGASLDYYTAVWAFPRLTVLLQSSLHSSLSEQFGNVTIELPKKTAPPSADQRKL